jgi:RsiW-degrading membrane proteinase PrsW (M82 family)
MSLSQNYGVLRVVQVRLTSHGNVQQSKYAFRWFSEERQVCLLTRRETMIGRALSNDFILMDPSVSREHARLVLEEQGWRVYNLTEQNMLHVNGQPVAAGGYVALHSQDFLVLGNTVLQFIAPSTAEAALLTESHLDKEDVPCYLKLAPLSCPPAEEMMLDAQFVELSKQKTPLEDITDGYIAVPSSSPPPIAHQVTRERVADLAAPELVPIDEKLFGGGITLQFVFARHLRSHKRWLIMGGLLGLLVLGACIIFLLNNALGFSTLIQENPLTLLSVLLIPTIAALGINVLVNFVDRYEREPWYLRLAAFLWGALIAIPPTVFIEQQVEVLRPLLIGANGSNALNALFSGLNAGVTEETFKGLGVLLLFMVLRDEFDNVTDGIVYGALIGAGFAMVENIMYFAGSPKTFLFLLISRIVLGWLNHSTFTVCFGAALGYIRHTRVRWQHIVIPLVGYLVSVSLHTAFDFVNSFANALVFTNPDNATVERISLFASIGDYLLIFVAQVMIIYVLIKSLAHEATIIREFLTSEVSNGIVNVEEYALLQHSFLRTRVERGVLLRYGFRQWLRVKALYQTEIGLAFRKWHVSMGDKPKLGYLQPEDAYRQRIQRLRHEILTVEAHSSLHLNEINKMNDKIKGF